ncbi:MAG: ATP-dependent DNA helicase RecG [Clostridiales bacterium]|nr:ATP-dependent DNA helicase RecG [Clostridiales bacterium]
MDISLSTIKGIGPARLKAFEAAGIRTVRELVMNLPREYRDLSATTPLSALKPGDTACVRVRVAGQVSEQRARRLLITRVYVTDDTDTIPVIWYNQPWLKKQMEPGRELLLYGKAEIKKGYISLISPTIEQEQGLIPVYRAIQGIPAKALRQSVEAALKMCEGQWPDELPESIRRRHGLCERNFAMRNAHFPDSHEALIQARRRIAFEELLLYQIALALYRNTGKKGIKFDYPEDTLEKFWKSLPFAPTNAQRRVLEEVSKDLVSDRAMARMVQGDVGSGKTAIAFAAIALAKAAGYQAALMAPTEVLARQHYEGAKQLLEPLGCRVGLLTGSLTAKQHRLAHEAIREGEWDVAIGTHALITEGVEYKNLGLVITDEQHRFGVRQRSMLSEKGDAPNVLVMSATPIPRTLSLILYGDLDISIVDELPPGRTPVATRIVPESRREGMYGFLRDEVKKGRQAYFVCPLVEESEAVDASPAEVVYEDLRTKHLPDLRVELVHGRMKAQDKDAVLEKFHKGEADILVSTTVIEVGVNVPNATVMVIENAERFGLAQLHQLRGRVGRGSHESWCFLMSEPNPRLKFLTSTNDGFKIAQKDMELRGPGELFGTRQSGALTAGIDMLASDTEMLKVTHDEARMLMKNRESDEAAQVIALARERFAQKLQEIAVN